MGRPPVEYDIRMRSRMLAYTQGRGREKGENQYLTVECRSAQERNESILTPTGAVTRIC